MKDAISRKKDVHKAMCWNSTVKNKKMCRSMKNKVDNAVSKAMNEMAKEALVEFRNRMFGLVKGLRIVSKKLKEEDIIEDVMECCVSVSSGDV